MDSRLSLLPYSAQYAVEQAANTLARSLQALRAKRRVTDRAVARGRAAVVRAQGLQDKMRDVKYAGRP
jgi:hypothetical protein